MTEDKEQTNLRYSEAISDFAGCIQENGALKVAEDFFLYYPTQCLDIVNCVEHIQKAKQIPALFKP